MKTLMCFICGCKHLYHIGYNKFGDRTSKGDIDYRRDVQKRLHKLLHGDEEHSLDRAWEFNLSRKRFKDHFGEAVNADVSFAQNTWEWRRKVRRDGQEQDIMCNPEDVVVTSACKHDENTVCCHCDIPICDECWRLALTNASIPKALTNDNFVGYLDEYIVRHRVSWLEATIACPVFTGLVTYYIEGAQEHRHHLMEEPLAQPQRAYAVRGSLFSFLMPWERIQADISKTLEQGDLSAWPMSPAQVHQVVRVRLMQGPKEILNKFKELRVRAQVVRDVAQLYITHHVKDLVDRPGVLAIHGIQRPLKTG